MGCGYDNFLKNTPTSWTVLISKAMNFNNPPNEADLLDAIEPKSFHIVITGHVAIEQVIEVCIVESVPNPSVLKLERHTFVQKLSLAVALGIIENSSVPGYKTLNTLRNSVAHDLVSTLDKQAIADLHNCLSTLQRKTLLASPTVDPLRSLREIIGTLYSELCAALKQRRERRLRAEAYNDMTREAIRTANYGQAWGESRRALEIDLRKRVDAKKAERGWTYVSPEGEYCPRDPYEFEFIAPQ